MKAIPGQIEKSRQFTLATQETFIEQSESNTFSASLEFEPFPVNPTLRVGPPSSGR